MAAKIVVVGSANTDMVIKTERLPKPGETVLGGQFATVQGGKGANQAVAAARLGGKVTFVTRLGTDSFGRIAAAAYQTEGINLDFLVWDDAAPSGVALILVNKNGENIIAVAPGANANLAPDDVLRAEPAIRKADCMLLQLEIPLPTVQTAAELARRHGVRVILNPAPAAALSDDLYRNVDVLTPNESEAALLAGAETDLPASDLARKLRALTRIPVIVLTMGDKGALTLIEQEENLTPAFEIEAIDTVAAGDAFNGGLAVALGNGQDLPTALRFASAAGAIAATRSGAQPSLPTLQEVKAFLAR